jgi:hypothetical protein
LQAWSLAGKIALGDTLEANRCRQSDIPVSAAWTHAIAGNRHNRYTRSTGSRTPFSEHQISITDLTSTPLTAPDGVAQRLK